MPQPASCRFDAFYSRQQPASTAIPNKTDAEDGVSKLSEAAKEERKKDSFQFHLRMLMLPFKRMRMYDDYPIYHMRVSKKGNPSQIGNKYQRKEEL